MKMNIKKVATIVGSALMLGATVGMAAAAAYPAPFVQNGASNVAIVVGGNAALSDGLAASSISSGLATSLAAQTATGASSSSSSIEGGDSVKLAKDTNAFNLGEDMNDFYSSLDNGELSVVLADGIYTNDNNDDFDYEQTITMGTSLVLEHFRDSEFNDDKAILGFDQSSGDTIMTYTLDFTPDVATFGTATTASDFPYLETTTIEMLGREYYIAKAEYGSTGAKLTLLDTANSAVITEGETKTVQVGSNSYEVSTSWIDADEAKIVVNGVETNKLSAGDIYKIADDTYVAVKSVLYNAKDSGVSSVEISLGSGKIVMENGVEVKMNNEDISDIYDNMALTSTIVNTTGLDTITLTWTLDDDAWIAPGNDLVLPGFETIKISMAGFNVPMQEITELNSDGDDSVKLKTTVKDGTVEFNLVYLDSTSTYIEGLGERSNHKLVTNATSGTTSSSPATIVLNETENSYFVATWISGDDSESYVYELSSITEGTSHTNSTTLKSLVNGGSDIVFSEVGDDKEAGQITMNLTASDDDTGAVTLNLYATSGIVYLDRLVTKEGMTVRLPVICTTNSTFCAANPGQGYINTNLLNTTGVANSTQISNPVSFALNVTEETKDGDIGSGNAFLANLTVDTADGIEVASLSNITLIETEDDSDLYEGYMIGALATKVAHKKPTSGLNDLVITYHGTESSADVYVSEASTIIVDESSDSGSATQLGAITIKDSEVSSVSGKNLIVIGGSCVNSVAAELLGGAACEAAFTAASGVKAGEALIKSFDRSGKVALLVAGYNAEDTTKAATYLTMKGADTTVGAALKVTSATEATAITA